MRFKLIILLFILIFAKSSFAGIVDIHIALDKSDPLANIFSRT